MQNLDFIFSVHPSSFQVVELFYLSILAAPFSLAAGENGLWAAYGTTAWFILTLVHSLCCCYEGHARRAVFWTYSATVL